MFSSPLAAAYGRKAPAGQRIIGSVAPGVACTKSQSDPVKMAPDTANRRLCHHRRLQIGGSGRLRRFDRLVVLARFDSAACFAALLGTSENGRWLIAPPLAPLDVKRQYRTGTLVLETEFQTETGRAAILDFMPPADGADLVRIVMGRSGRVDFRTEYVARFNYGATIPGVRRLYDGAISAPAGSERLVLWSQVPLYGEDLKTVGEFTLEDGQSVAFVLSYGTSFLGPPSAIDPFESLHLQDMPGLSPRRRG